MLIRKRKLRQGFLPILSVVFTCMAAADAQEISQLDGFRALRDGTQQKIWYGDQASNVWNYFSGTYPNYLEPKDRFYGKDIAIDVPIATKATIFPPDQSDGDSESNIKITATIPFEQLTCAEAREMDSFPLLILDKDTATVQIPPDQLCRFGTGIMAAAMTALNTDAATLEIPSDQLTVWKEADIIDALVVGSNPTSVQIPYDEIAELDLDATNTPKLYLEGIVRNCTTPDPILFWDQVLIRSKGEIVICQ